MYSIISHLLKIVLPPLARSGWCSTITIPLDFLLKFPDNLLCSVAFYLEADL